MHTQPTRPPVRAEYFTVRLDDCEGGDPFLHRSGGFVSHEISRFAAEFRLNQSIIHKKNRIKKITHPYATAVVPLALVDAIPPIVASAPGSTGKPSFFTVHKKKWMAPSFVRQPNAVRLIDCVIIITNRGIDYSAAEINEERVTLLTPVPLNSSFNFLLVIPASTTQNESSIDISFTDFMNLDKSMETVSSFIAWMWPSNDVQAPTGITAKLKSLHPLMKFDTCSVVWG